MPEFLGKLGSVETFNESGKLFAKVGNEIKEVFKELYFFN